MIRNKIIRPTVLLFSVFILFSGLTGCELKQQTEELRETGRQLRSDLNEIKSYGQVDLESKAKLDLFYQAFVACVQKGNPPSNWSDLTSRSGIDPTKLIELRTVQSDIKDVVWGAKLENLDDPEKARARLATFQNRLLGNTIIIQADGNYRAVTREELAEIPAAE